MSVWKAAAVVIHARYDIREAYALKDYLEEGGTIENVTVGRDTAPKYRAMFEEEYTQQKLIGIAEDECVLSLYAGKYVSPDECAKALKILTAKLKLKGFKVLDGREVFKQII